MEDEVQLADVAEALVQRFDEDLDEVEDGQFGLGGVAAEDEVESGEVTEHELAVGADQVAALHEVAAVVGLARHQLERLGQDPLLSTRRQMGVELAESRLAVVVEHEDGVDHDFEVSRDQNVNRRCATTMGSNVVLSFVATITLRAALVRILSAVCVCKQSKVVTNYYLLLSPDLNSRIQLLY